MYKNNKMRCITNRAGLIFTLLALKPLLLPVTNRDVPLHPRHEMAGVVAMAALEKPALFVGRRGVGFQGTRCSSGVGAGGARKRLKQKKNSIMSIFVKSERSE